LLYAVSVLQYIGRTRIGRFFEKVADRLEPRGAFFLCYHHFRAPRDLWYPDLTYIQYSPRLVERLSARCIAVIDHVQAVDGRLIGLYARRPYRSPIPGIDNTFLNSSRLVGCKERV
jgi:hypothetical protein